jgi:hypothetical protein
VRYNQHRRCCGGDDARPARLFTRCSRTKEFFLKMPPAAADFATLPRPPLRLFAGTANRPLAEAVARALGIELGGLQISRFPGQRTVRQVRRVGPGRQRLCAATNVPAD